MKRRRAVCSDTVRLAGFAALAAIVLLASACHRPTYELDLEVRSSEDGAPVVGAEVIVAARGWGRADYLVWDREYRVSGITDAEGRYRRDFVSAPIGLPAGGQQPHLIRIRQSGFDTLVTTLPVNEDRLTGRFVLEPAGTTRERLRQQREALQRIREMVLRLNEETLVVEVGLKPETPFPTALFLALHLGGFRCAEERIEVTKADRPIQWSIDHAVLLECYLEKSGVRGGALADLFLRVEATVEQAGDFALAAAVRREMKVELDFVSDDASRHSISLVDPERQP